MNRAQMMFIACAAVLICVRIGYSFCHDGKQTDPVKHSSACDCKHDDKHSKLQECADEGVER